MRDNPHHLRVCKMVVSKSLKGNYRIVKNKNGCYVGEKLVCNTFGAPLFWQQRTKQYLYLKCCVKVMTPYFDSDRG